MVLTHSQPRGGCVSLSGCVTQRTLSWDSEGALRRRYRKAAQSGGERRSGKTTLTLHCLHPDSCPTPAASSGVWPPKACLPLSLPPLHHFRPHIPKVNHHTSPQPCPGHPHFWQRPCIYQMLGQNSVSFPAPYSCCSSPKPEGKGTQDKLPKWTAPTDHLLNFCYLIIFLKPIHF